MGVCPSKDMAICLVLFNPVKTKKLVQNYFTMIEKLKGLPVFTLELVYPGREPEIPEAIHIPGSSIMFHKENLCRILETHVPEKYTKLAFLDADILFDDSNWYAKASKALENHDVVQLFTKAQWLDSDGESMLERESVLKMRDVVWNWKYHPGFAWGFRREWYTKIGFFDYAVSGSGDTLSAMKWLKKDIPKGFKSLPNPLHKRYSEYCPNPPRITCLTGTVQHLYHGSRENRQYTERHKLLDVREDIDELLEKRQGLFTWKDPKWNSVFLEYFVSRNDDSVELLTS
jgi:hypothetical protein